MNLTNNFEFDEEDDASISNKGMERFSEAVLYATDWTVETILSQLSRNNIQLNPNFQRRDAWSNSRKSKFIESIIIGLPIPQLVLAEVKEERGKYIVLDGKQRLLSLLRYTESRDDPKRGFGLSSLEARPDLARIKYSRLYSDPNYEQDLNSFLNYTIRTVIIRNWPTREFLYQVFLRLNTGSVKLSSQELRQAMAPGGFSTFADDFSAASKQILALLGRDEPDPRMRDVELLVRHLAFRNNLASYGGRMKSFLDEFCIAQNRQWENAEPAMISQAHEFERGIDVLMRVLKERLGRKPDSQSFNRAVFDALSFYTVHDEIRKAMLENADRVREEYDAIFKNERFADAIESDTAGVPNTVARLELWGQSLARACDQIIERPQLVNGEIVFTSNKP
ncbi:MAG: DUF262 domain-containing protein [Rhizobiaceae bacterium]|nr:DUF262 domain-containing protein [Rhizobiaceae bacterium]